MAISLVVLENGHEQYPDGSGKFTNLSCVIAALKRAINHPLPLSSIEKISNYQELSQSEPILCS